ALPGAHQNSPTLTHLFSTTKSGDRRDAVRSVALSPTSSLLATGHLDGTVRIWNISTRTCETVLSIHKGAVLSLLFSPDGTVLASGGEKSDIQLTRIAGGASSGHSTFHVKGATCLSYSPDGRVLAIATR